MKYLVLCGTLTFLLFINTVHSAVNIVASDEAISFNRGTSLVIACNVSYDATEEKPDVEWYKENKKVTEVDRLKSRVTQKWDGTRNILTIPSASEDDAGNFSCRALQKGEQKAAAIIKTAVKIAVGVPKNINVVEEEKLMIECKVFRNPELRWRFKNETYTESRGRVTLQNYTDDGKLVQNGIFVVERITKEDRGNVTCIGIDPLTDYEDEQNCTVRVRDKYAPLWPFFGICAEVIILCAIIVIYEKKRNKTELEESDTDQSPDQKNTPDHGKEANLRHRQ